MDFAFHKLHGCGNDFVFVDNRQLQIPVTAMSDLALRLCARKVGVGADGLIFIEAAPEDSPAAYRWHFYNADGSRGEMCGNASRCVAWLAVELGLAGSQHCFLADAGLISALVDYTARWAKVELTKPLDLRLNISLPTSQGVLQAHFVNTGVPHAVLLMDDNSQVDVNGLGREIRNHQAFAPKGTNVNFISLPGPDLISMRTYERGVEAETLACGTGAAAAQVICRHLGLTQDKVKVKTTGGEILQIELCDTAVFLAGQVTRVYQGVLDQAFWRQGL